MDSDACDATLHSPSFATFEVILSALVATLAVAAIVLLRSRWKTWYKNMVQMAFNDIDQDGSGTIARDELWAGVLMLYIRLRQQNIPADPPLRAVVDELLERCDFNRDGRLSLDEFEDVVNVLSVQALGRAIAMVFFIAVWPALSGIGYNSVSDQLRGQPAPSWMPDGLVCFAALLDDLHVPSTVLIVLGFVFVVPHLTAFTDWCAALLQQKKAGSAAGADPTPLLSR